MFAIYLFVPAVLLYNLIFVIVRMIVVLVLIIQKNCVKPFPVKTNLVKTFWQLYKKPCTATHNKLKHLLRDFDNINLYLDFEQCL